MRLRMRMRMDVVGCAPDADEGSVADRTVDYCIDESGTALCWHRSRR